MELLVANISGKTRFVSHNGRKYIVAPMTLIVEGVLNGSQGALYYPPDEIVKNYSEWEGMPLLAYHPISLDGRHISAMEGGVIARQGIGFVKGPKVVGNGDKLQAEGWFDIERCKRINKSIYNSLVKRQPIELSTGLFTNNQPAQNGSHFQGKPYTHTARDYRPDHVAVLPDQKGACAISDGCGVLVNCECGGIKKKGDNDCFS